MKNKLISAFLIFTLSFSACSAASAKQDSSVSEPSALTESSSGETASAESPLPEQTFDVQESVPDAESTATSGQSYEKYQLAVADAENLLRDKVTDLDLIEEGYGFSSIFATTNPDCEILGYLQKDLDGDGIDELIFGENDPNGQNPPDAWDSVIYNIFTVRGQEMYVLARGWERNRYYLCDDGIIANDKSGGAAYSCWTYYVIDGLSLSAVESIYQSDDENGDIHWYHTDGESYTDDGELISSEEAQEIIDAHPIGKLSFTPFENAR